MCCFTFFCLIKYSINHSICCQHCPIHAFFMETVGYTYSMWSSSSGCNPTAAQDKLSIKSTWNENNLINKVMGSTWHISIQLFIENQCHKLFIYLVNNHAFLNKYAYHFFINLQCETILKKKIGTKECIYRFHFPAEYPQENPAWLSKHSHTIITHILYVYWDHDSLYMLCLIFVITDT